MIIIDDFQTSLKKIILLFSQKINERFLGICGFLLNHAFVIDIAEVRCYDTAKLNRFR